MNTFVFLVILIVLCLEDVTSLICNSASPEPKRELQPSTKELRKYYCEGEVAEIDCESAEYFHQWHQGYQTSNNWESSNGSNKLAIGKIPYLEGTLKSNYSIKIEKFDNNTSMYCKNERNSKNYVKKLDILVQLCDDSTNNNRTSEQQIHRYSENKSIPFSCEEHVKDKDKNDTFIGAINTIFNNITTVAAPALTLLTLNKTDNGTYILCCIYYEVNVTDGVTKITRRVANKTLLIYDDDVQQDSLESTGMPSTIAELSGRTITLYIVSVVGGTILLVVAIVICKKQCRKKVIPENKIIFYADLDLLRNAEVQPERRFSKTEEEAPYAEIIGVMKPNQ